MNHHISIDFEGEGPRADGTAPPPMLLGALVPSSAGGSGRMNYHLWLLVPELSPIAKSPTLSGPTSLRRVCSFREAIEEVVALAESRGCRLVAYSDHERMVVTAQLGDRDRLVQAFTQRFYNVKRRAVRLARERGKGAADKTLKELIQKLMPGHHFPGPPKGGVGVALRRLVVAGRRSQRWRNWTPTQQQLARDLIAYNRGDCRAVHRLTHRVVSSYRLPDLETTVE